MAELLAYHVPAPGHPRLVPTGPRRAFDLDLGQAEPAVFLVGLPCDLV